MTSHETFTASTTDGLPVAPSLAPSLQNAHMPHQAAGVTRRTVALSAAAMVLAAIAAVVAQGLTALIALFTNLSFYGRLSLETVSPADHQLGPLVIVVPVVGALIIGVMARYGSKAIRGHGIPEAMEQVLLNQSRIPARMTLLKPLSAAISIGTGGPFGAEGPIIATGGALGSLIGQWLPVHADERKTLLAAGAAAGMAATFGSPVSAVLLAVELLLFEYKPRSVLPVALAAVTATAVRAAFVGRAPVFPMDEVELPSTAALAIYIVLGAVIGIASVITTRAVYWIEDLFEKLPIHWMWWPAIGGLVVGVVGLISPHTMGVGYDNIEGLLQGRLVGEAVIWLCLLKFVSWSIALGSGTSGGTLAPLFTIGGALGAICVAGVNALFPALGVDVRIGALVGMAAMFAGASRALLASVVFAFETTRQPMGLLPLLGGCSASYMLSALMMRNSIMTEKLERRGARVLTEYGADFLAGVNVKVPGVKPVQCLEAAKTVASVRGWLETCVPSAAHHAYPVLDDGGLLVGVVTRKQVAAADPALSLGQCVARAPVVVYDDQTLRDAEDTMVRENIGCLPVVSREQPRHVIGILTRKDLFAAHRKRLSL